jgi:hypothetical protein
MIETTVGELKRHDEFKTAANGGTYTVTSNQPHHYDSALRQVYGNGRDTPVLITTPETKVLALSMVREVQVSCLALTHPGEEPVTILHDRAKGPQPRSVFCGDCAAAADEAAEAGL